MCGRARCTLSAAQAARAFGFPTTAVGGGGDAPAVPTLHIDRFRPSYNVSPGAYLPVGAVRARPAGGADGGGGAGEVGPVIQCMKWGLVPSFTGKTEKPDHFRMFNARSESVKEKASFRRLIPKNRCLVAVEGFYEWKKDGSKKQPYYIHFQVIGHLYLQAFMTCGQILKTIYTFTILTTRASTSLKWLHDRMPVILSNKDCVNAWLNDASVKLEEMTAPYEEDDLVWYPVTSAMGKASFDVPECIKEVSVGPSEKPISKFFTKKSIAHDEPGKPEKVAQELTETNAPRAPKVKCDESVGQSEEIKQQPGDKHTRNTVKDEPAILEPQVLKKPHSIKHEDVISGDAHFVSAKRKIEDAEVNLHIKMENSSRSPSRPMKKKKGSKAASDGQASLLSYFAKN